jgi:hypothetical protein
MSCSEKAALMEKTADGEKRRRRSSMEQDCTEPFTTGEQAAFGRALHRHALMLRTDRRPTRLPRFALSLFAATAVGSLLTAGCIGPGEPQELTPEEVPATAYEHPMIPALAEPAPLVDDAWVDAPACAQERCAGIEPIAPPVNYSFVLTGVRTRGSNTQLAIPQNLLLADVNADGITDFLQYSSNKLFASKTDFNKTGILHLYLRRPIKRVLTGDFHGDRNNQICAILDDNSMQCYGISTDRTALWWWFTQGSFVADNEDAIVGDFDGDGRDDVLVYPRSGGAFRLYSVKGSAFFAATPSYSQGNLSGVNASGMQVRAGDFNGDGRDDVMIVNPSRQILYYGSVFDGTNNTFWWAFTTNGGFVGSNDQVTVARIDDDARDDVVLHDRVSGATRFYRMQYASGNLPAITNVTTGQISPVGNSQIFWGYMHGPLFETGAANRDDALVYDQTRNMFVRSDARWSGSQLTYWWAYTQYAPNNHTGWAAFAAKNWLLIKCQFSDVSTIPQNNQFYRDLMLGNGGLSDYWRDLSYGSWDLSGSTVIDTWYNMSITNADWRALASRWDRAGRCMSAYGGSTSGYVNVISLVNGEGDAGNYGGRVLVTPDSSNVTFVGHETGHTFGWWVHSFDDTNRQNASWSQPGEYFDTWDIMSAMAVYTFSNPLGVAAGPEMNAPYKAKQSFIPAHRQVKLVPGSTLQTWRSNIAAINKPEGNGALLVRVGNDDNNYYTVEYRMKSGWDQGIPRATVLVHRVTNGTSYLITAGGTERLVGSTSSFILGARAITVTVNGFAAQGFTADVSVTY